MHGKFTQEDPIGLAGGLNLYGYANGDPVNLSDPFGLDPCEHLDPEEDTEEWVKCKGKQYEKEDAEKAAEEERLTQRRECIAAGAEMGARLIVDAASLSILTSAVPLIIEGGALVAAGSLVNTETAVSLGVTWGRRMVGRSRLASGVGLVGANRGAGVSVLPINAFTFGSTFFQACGR